MKIVTDETIIDAVLSRSVVEILPSKDALRAVLLSGRQIKIYIGADATGTSLHVGHATNYMILENFRKLGHKVVILIGNFTAQIGDPTDKTAARVQLSREQVLENTKTWVKQLRPIIDIDNKENPVEIVYNHDWLAKMTFEDVIKLAFNFTVQQMLERDMFEKRISENKPIYVHEFFYPLMQGYDSVYLDVDIEMCGNDQKFNALTGRTLLRRYKNKEKFVFITTLLENPVTKEKMMSKSQGTGVFLDMSNIDMYGKLMAQPDENIPQLFRDCTFFSIDEIDKIKHKLANKEVNPRDIKMRLAFEITKIYHGEESAKDAEENFKSTFQKKEIPDDILEISVHENVSLADVLTKNGVTSSKTDFRRLVGEGAVKQLMEGGVEEKIINDTEDATPGVYKIGKRRFVKITN